MAEHVGSKLEVVAILCDLVNWRNHETTGTSMLIVHLAISASDLRVVVQDMKLCFFAVTYDVIPR